ncbi:MAG: alpha/beta fold hydrolase [Stappiaceae bacterium]
MPRRISILFLAIIALFSLSKPSIAQPERDSAGSVVEVEVPALALEGNLLGTPTTQTAAVYLPPGYENESDQRYPVIYLLHGIFDDHGVWLENYNVPAILDHLITENRIPELIVVMPDGGNKYGGGYYRNSPVSGRWGDYIANNLVEFVDAQFRTLANLDNRAVVGHSMGGYGALNLAMSHPGIFSVVWAMSPCCLAANDDLSFGNDAWKRAAGVSTPSDIQTLLENRDFYPVAILGVTAAFSPNPDSPPVYGDFPFDIVRGEVVLREAEHDRFLDALPLRQVRDARQDLRALKGLALGVGLGDQFLHIPTGTLEFSQQLGSQRIPHLLDVYDGDHRQKVGKRLETLVFPWVAQRIGSTQ